MAQRGCPRSLDGKASANAWKRSRTDAALRPVASGSRVGWKLGNNVLSRAVMTGVTRTAVMVWMHALSASALSAQFMDLSSFAGGWNCYMDRRGAEGTSELLARQCSSPDAGLAIRRTSSHGAVLAPLPPRMHETSMKVMAGVTFWVDGWGNDAV